MVSQPPWLALGLVPEGGLVELGWGQLMGALRSRLHLLKGPGWGCDPRPWSPAPRECP